jgi:hypothetical protein
MRKNWKNGKKRYIDLKTALPTKEAHKQFGSILFKELN